MNAIVAALDLKRHSSDRFDGASDWSPVALASRVGLVRGTERQTLDDTIGLLAEARETIDELRERIAYLESLTMTDELTGLLNRRGFYSHFRRELAQARRHGSAGGLLVMIDLDGFKAINDTHGHLAGDAYLRHIARLIVDNVRQEDVVARLGGDEFAVLLTNTDTANGLARARQLAAIADATHVEWGGQALPIRFSVGTQPYGGEDSEDEVMRRADTMMYGAKNARRRSTRRKVKAAA
ncbi:GGDEF domain-containing protein [Azospirillum picis]|uniref:diguanylate cyclase n=1 Tax=Azospirillum picis TaxID=488438 RepID=A0ABU0ME61_9PROT|nr:GGDEF domain-containing protein [Azospirillum picis]MBP2297825.1 diguanylate cyclase (GGDEF)-like protein [Azospirillum picis]MDQ0531663.1 diguanylate cyclase (GGDEF)-like protein [Azospirillum picis]